MTQTQTPPKKRRKWWKMIIIVLVVLLVPILYLCFKPLNVGDLAVMGKPAQSYVEALERVKGLDAPVAGKLGPVGGTLLLTHGKKTDKVVVLLHGYTKSPHEFLPLGQMLFAKGYNVLIPRLPHHGLADHMTTDQALLTAEEVAAFANEVVDCAHGLGEHITVCRALAGGLTTAWAAQNRVEVERAVVMSPAFGYKKIPTAVTRPVMNYYLTMPNSFNWWDDKHPGPLVAGPLLSSLVYACPRAVVAPQFRHAAESGGTGSRRSVYPHRYQRQRCLRQQ